MQERDKRRRNLSAVAESPDGEVALATLAHIRERQGQLLLHAGAIGAADGRVAVIHGPSGSGKTTLTAALTTEGLAYLTDETLCLDPLTLAIEPFPKPLTVKSGAQEVLAHLRPRQERIDRDSGNWQVDPAALEGPPIPDVELQPALIVFPDYRADFAGVEANPVSRARASFVLGEQSSALWAIEPRPLAALARLVTRAPAFRVTYGDAFAAAPVIVADLLPAVPPTATVEKFGDRPVPAGPEIRWAEGVDWLELDGEVVVFDGEHLHHLDLPGAAVWTRLDGRRDLPAVAVDIAAEFDADPERVLLDAEDLARVLASHRLLEGTHPDR